ncbi:hypothetical protein MKX08_002264 [Trichoderma sp. CBMAI-0020]|nr:hypothetical protein MKX08_002264 [Trichoderma sp. CBMAI-0020]
MDERLAWMPFPPGTLRDQTENIRIGAIIANPSRPNQVLTTVDDSILRITAPSFWRRCWERFSSGMSMLSFYKEKHTQIGLDANVLVTKEFPEDLRQTEIMSRLENPTVAQYVNEPTRLPLGLWNRENPVYMITGLKFAKGKIAHRRMEVEINQLRFRHHIADPISWIGTNQSDSLTQKWETDEETLVAYKLLKIEKNRQRKTDSDDELILTEVTVKGCERFY